MRLSEALEYAGVPIAAALAFGVSRQTVQRHTAKQVRASFELAVRLGAFFGNGPSLWIRMQAACDEWHAEQTTAPVRGVDRNTRGAGVMTRSSLPARPG